MDKKSIIGIIVLVVVAAGAFVFSSSLQNGKSTEFPAASREVGGEEASIANSGETEVFSMEEVEAANTRDRCYAVVDGGVYDLTPWINSHPGGSERIIRLCGTDATEAFSGKHGENRKANEILETFKVGILK